jgi:hypothetical protein
MDKAMLDLYSDYLLASSGAATATGLAALVERRLSHDAISRFLAGGGQEASAREWWLTVKPLVRRVEAEDGVLIFDDTIIEKPHTDENAIVCWHFDHAKGLNLLTAPLPDRRGGARPEPAGGLRVGRKTRMGRTG